MKNRIVGFMVIGIALLIGFIILAFNRAMTDIVNTSCTHGPACPMWGTINFQTNVSLGIMAFVVLIGLYLAFLAKEPAANKAPSRQDYKKIMAKLSDDERLVLHILADADGSFFQSELAEKTGFNKVKITRVLDKLEGKQLIERKRRGMTNIIILKHH